MNSNILIFDYQGNSISFELTGNDVMINATEMVKLFPGKKINHFLSNQQTKDLVLQIESETGIPASQLIVSLKGNTAKYNQGTWINEFIIFKFIEWLGGSDINFKILSFLINNILKLYPEKICNYDEELLIDYYYDLADIIGEDCLNPLFKSSRTINISTSNKFSISYIVEKLYFLTSINNIVYYFTKSDLLKLVYLEGNYNILLRTISFLNNFIDNSSPNSKDYIFLKYMILSSMPSVSSTKINKIQKTYLMKDSNTGYTKIGKAVDPKFREKTLQSEKPSISLFAVCDSLVESELHEKYESKRIRGEWFNLCEDDIGNIISNYKFTKT